MEYSDKIADNDLTKEIEMQQKLELDVNNLTVWRSTQWNLYASQMYKTKLLRLWMNADGMYRVYHGEDVIYEGSQMTHAIAAWDSA